MEYSSHCFYVCCSRTRARMSTDKTTTLPILLGAWIRYSIYIYISYVSMTVCDLSVGNLMPIKSLKDFQITLFGSLYLIFFNHSIIYRSQTMVDYGGGWITFILSNCSLLVLLELIPESSKFLPMMPSSLLMVTHTALDHREYDNSDHLMVSYSYH